MSLWDVSPLLISSLQQSRYSSFYLDFRLQHLTSGTWELSSKPNNALHRHWLCWASSSAQSQIIPGCFHAQSFARTLVADSGDLHVAESVPWTSSWKPSPALVLLPPCRFCSENILTIPHWAPSALFFLSFSPCHPNFSPCCCGHFGGVCVCAAAVWDPPVEIAFGALDVRIRAVKTRLSQSN